MIAGIVKNSSKESNSIILANLHQLKGTAGTLGLQLLAQQAEHMEKELKSGITDNLKQETETLKSLFLNYKNTYRDLFNFH